MPHIVEIFGKPDCHLCEAVLQTLLRVQQTHPFELRRRNIEGDAWEFRTRYRELIPVVLLNGREIARYRLSEAEMVAALKSAGQ